jgi:hypothetical protein
MAQSFLNGVLPYIFFHLESRLLIAVLVNILISIDLNNNRPLYSGSLDPMSPMQDTDLCNRPSTPFTDTSHWYSSHLRPLLISEFHCDYNISSVEKS